jgi:hypothetical protein
MHYAMKAYGEVGVYIHVSLTLPLVGDELSASRPYRFNPGERGAGTHWIVNCEGPNAGRDYRKK